MCQVLSVQLLLAGGCLSTACAHGPLPPGQRPPCTAQGPSALRLGWAGAPYSISTAAVQYSTHQLVQRLLVALVKARLARRLVRCLGCPLPPLLLLVLLLQVLHKARAVEQLGAPPPSGGRALEGSGLQQGGQQQGSGGRMVGRVSGK